MRSVLTRITALSAVAVAVLTVASCDTRLPTATFTSTTTTTGANGVKVVIDTPLAGSAVNVGDSILVSMRLHGTNSLVGASIVGVSEAGSVDLGTFTRTVRYNQIVIPVTGPFRSGLRDTTIRRYLKAVDTTDKKLDSLVILAIATDSVGGADTARTSVNLVAGPHVSIVNPTSADSLPAGAGLSVAARATKSDGLGRVDIRVQGEANWPTPLDVTISKVFANAPRDTTVGGVVTIPANAPGRGRITITAVATDVSRQTGAASPIVVFVRVSPPPAPRVTQVVAPRLEATDSVKITATGQSIVSLGVAVRDSTGTVVQRDSILLAQPFASNASANVGLTLPPAMQGQRVDVTGFAVDAAGRTGYAVAASTTIPQTTLASAFSDTALIVYGHTYQVPRSGIIGDIAVDQARGHVFLSNTSHNLLELWDGASQRFDLGGVAVGSLPWGMTFDLSGDTLVVANSGGTNFSKVAVAANPIAEVGAARLLTRSMTVYELHQSIDQATKIITITLTDPPTMYSDRPQYVGMSRAGRLFYSTRPTTSAPAGTIRWLDPTLQVPDPKQVYSYATHVTDSTEFAVFNTDSIKFDVDVNGNTQLVLCDHLYGTNDPGQCFFGSTIQEVVHADSLYGGDAVAVPRLDIASLALTDTTFEATSGTRNWIAFGEGNKIGVGRVMMISDTTTSDKIFFSPSVPVRDLTDNASERVFGLAVDLNGKTVGAHGSKSYFSAVDNPFHLRLQGVYDSFASGAGIAFHPSADGPTSSGPSSLAFVASANSLIEMVDIFHYNTRGTLPVKASFYGPLRATLRFPTDPPDVVVKLFGMTANGLVVIDVRAQDIH